MNHFWKVKSNPGLAGKYVKQKVILSYKYCFFYSLALFKNKKNHPLALRLSKNLWNIYGISKNPWLFYMTDLLSIFFIP